ncbi:hypothetical protein [Teichococcus aestuarii]|uniref:hypothetical protein n=1 Tax=Teichococcus aestuarii TaxID=568898 RepID=UPI003615BAC2
MTPTRFFLIRHAIVEPSARVVMYGDMDVAICSLALAQESAAYAGWRAACRRGRAGSTPRSRAPAPRPRRSSPPATRRPR